MLVQWCSAYKMKSYYSMYIYACVHVCMHAHMYIHNCDLIYSHFIYKTYMKIVCMERSIYSNRAVNFANYTQWLFEKINFLKQIMVHTYYSPSIHFLPCIMVTDKLNFALYSMNSKIPGL